MTETVICEDKSKTLKLLWLYALGAVSFSACVVLFATPYFIQTTLLAAFFACMAAYYGWRYRRPSQVLLVLDSDGVKAKGKLVPWRNIDSVQARRSDTPAFCEVVIVASGKEALVVSDAVLPMTAEDMQSLLLEYRDAVLSEAGEHHEGS
jgi:hypothetical protein